MHSFTSFLSVINMISGPEWADIALIKQRHLPGEIPGEIAEQLKNAMIAAGVLPVL